MGPSPPPVNSKDSPVMSLKTHFIFNQIFLAYYKINVDSYVEM